MTEHASNIEAAAPQLAGSAEIDIAGHRYTKPERLASLLGGSKRTLARWDARRIGPQKITIGKTDLCGWEEANESGGIRARQH